MKRLYHRAYWVSNKTISSGLIQNLYNSYPDLYSFNMSSWAADEGGKGNDCILYPTRYCVSENTENSYFTIIFPDSFLNITGFSYYSASSASNRAAYKLEIYSLSHETQEWKHLCSINAEEDYFHNKISYAECMTKNYTQGLKFVQRGTNKAGNYQLAVRFLDFFGDLVQLKPAVITFCIHKYTLHLHPFIFLLFHSE